MTVSTRSRREQVISGIGIAATGFAMVIASAHAFLWLLFGNWTRHHYPQPG